MIECNCIRYMGSRGVSMVVTMQFAKIVVQNLYETTYKNVELVMSWPVGASKCLHDLYSSSNIIQVTKSREVIWAGHVAHLK